MIASESMSVCSTLLVAGLALSLLAPDPAMAGQVQPDPDSVAARRAARDAQRRFESRRMRLLPRGTEGWDCDEIVGRMCLGPEDPDWTPVPEAPEVIEERQRLRSVLARLGTRYPGDAWILGQRVRYAVEAGDFARADSVLRSCRTNPPWWCDALRGFTAHADQRYVTAERDFDRALAAMPDSVRCAWNDLSHLLDDGRSDYRRLSCADRRHVEAEFWLLADPLYGQPGNDRRSEHFTRHVWNRLQVDARSAYGIRWGRDLSEIVIRFGWPVGFDALRTRRLGGGSVRVIQAHRLPRAQPFVPPFAWTAGSQPMRQTAWKLDDTRPRTAYAPPAGRVDTVAHQVARFRRGTTAVVVAALPPSLPDEDTCKPKASAHIASSSHDMSSYNPLIDHVFIATWIPERAGSHPVFSAELHCPAEERAARARYRLDPLSRDALLSDPLYLQAVGPLPGTFDAAVRHARTARRAAPGDTLDLFWEWYGPRRMSGDVRVTVRLEREQGGLLRRVGSWLGLGGDREAVGLEWLDNVEDGPGRTVRLVLPDLPEGRYKLHIDVRASAFRHATTTGELEIRR